MSRLTWSLSRDYESGLDRGVFYPQNAPAEAWNGLTSVEEGPSESDNVVRYIDGLKSQNKRRLGVFAGTIKAFSYPPSFYKSVLMQRRAERFGFSYRVQSGNGFKIHLVYNVLASPSTTIDQHDELRQYSWNFTTTPMLIPGARNSSHLIVDTSKAYGWTVEALEELLYGSDDEIARLPEPGEILALFENNSILQVVDNGDGTFTVTGPDSVVEMLDATTFQITWPSAVYIDDVSYTISSL